jgi:hypothetical protein
VDRRKKKRETITHREETGRCQRFAEFDANGFTTEFTEAGTLRAERVGGTLLG